MFENGRVPGANIAIMGFVRPPMRKLVPVVTRLVYVIYAGLATAASGAALRIFDKDAEYSCSKGLFGIGDKVCKIPIKFCFGNEDRYRIVCAARMRLRERGRRRARRTTDQGRQLLKRVCARCFRVTTWYTVGASDVTGYRQVAGVNLFTLFTIIKWLPQRCSKAALASFRSSWLWYGTGWYASQNAQISARSAPCATVGTSPSRIVALADAGQCGSRATCLAPALGLPSEMKPSQ